MAGSRRTYIHSQITSDQATSAITGAIIVFIVVPSPAPCWSLDREVRPQTSD
jgi:hypothetical protein